MAIRRWHRCSPVRPRPQAKFGGSRGQQALKTLAFWAVTLAFASQALSITGITFHIVSIGAEMGIAEASMVKIFIPIAVISTSGWLRRRNGLRSHPAALHFYLYDAGAGDGIAAIANLDRPGMLIPAALGLGISGGCFGTLTTVVLPRFFGRAHLGAIAGVQMMMIVIASALARPY